MKEAPLSLKWNNHKTTFFENLKILRDKSNYTDATLAVEGKFYPVHKLVMCTCSEYFSDIFEKTPCKKPVIVLKDVQCHDIEALLDYMYLGEVNINQSDLTSLLKTAACLKIKGLPEVDEDPTKLRKNSTSRLDDAHQDKPPPKRRRHDSNTISPHAASPVPLLQKSTTALINPIQTSSIPQYSTSNIEQDESSVVKVEVDDAEEQEETIRREKSVEGGASSDRDPDGDYESDITKTEHELEVKVEMDDAENQEERFRREKHYEGDFSSNQAHDDRDCVSDTSKTDHEPEDDGKTLLPGKSSLPGPSQQRSVVSKTDHEPKDDGKTSLPVNSSLPGTSQHPSDVSKTDQKPKDDGNISLPDNSSLPGTSQQPSDVSKTDHKPKDDGNISLPDNSSLPGPSIQQSGVDKMQYPWFHSGDIAVSFKEPHSTMYHSSPMIYPGQQQNQLTLSAHEDLQSSTTGDHLCGYCGKKFDAPVYLKKHLRAHTYEKKFKCPHCDFRTTLKGKLNSHIRNRHSYIINMIY